MTEHIVEEQKNIIIIPGDGKDHPSYVVNKKTEGVSIVDETSNIIKIQETPSRKIFSLSSKAVEQLSLEDDSVNVKMKYFSNSETIIKYLQRNPNIKGVLIHK
ncbi:MAG: hypothetical protein HRU07_05760 [Nitrosopumilus sp.]|nr:hypothetical protein [Nitrosopumilus sp.]NRA05652.1 hypothetical protein [Nitrosopumilus sp.]